MLPDSEHPQLALQVRTMQIIVAALTMGCGTFLAVVLFLRSGGRPVVETPLVTFGSLAACMGLLAARAVVPRLFAGAALRQVTPQVHEAQRRGDLQAVYSQLVQIYQTRMIVGAALLEGAAFLMGIAYLIEGRTVALLLAALLVVGVASHVPTQSGVARWILERCQEEEQNRHLP